MSAVVGIDPGQKGGIAWVSSDNAMAWKMPETERDLWELVRSLAPNASFAMLEQVNAKPGGDGDDKRRMGAKGAMAFGENVGLCRMALTGNSIPYERILPTKWQRAMGLPTLKQCGGSQTAKKNRHKDLAQRLFPALRISHATADALLIAACGHRHREGEK